ncbi:hypothetical protein H8356DRAFT_1353973 [Neocallimastix lanati (nom. inval.)]|nr:hypothetical protein H8356DRAFT_1353973 [Neocallimastix sp. JGI-2020a]
MQNCNNESLYTRINRLLQNIVINKIILPDNNDIDEERAVIQNNKYRKSIQGKVYHDYYYNNYTKYNWIAFFSIDEFITVNYKYNNVDNRKLFYENKSIVERFLRKNNFKHSKGVKNIIKFKDYNYELLNGGPVVQNKASVIANVYNKEKNKEYSIGLLTLRFVIISLINTLSFIDYIDKHLCENANIPPIVIIVLSKN